MKMGRLVTTRAHNPRLHDLRQENSDTLVGHKPLARVRFVHYDIALNPRRLRRFNVHIFGWLRALASEPVDHPRQHTHSVIRI